jgi:hypothetical protein
MVQSEMTSLFGRYDLGLIDKIFDPYDVMNVNKRKCVNNITDWIKYVNKQLTIVQKTDNSEGSDIRGDIFKKIILSGPIEKQFGYIKNRFAILRKTFRNPIEWFNSIFKLCLV